MNHDIQFPPRYVLYHNPFEILFVSIFRNYKHTAEFGSKREHYVYCYNQPHIKKTKIRIRYARKSQHSETRSSLFIWCR